MKTITKKTTVTTERGTVINFKVTETRGYEKRESVSYCDGDNVSVSKMEVIDKTIMVAEINGTSYCGDFWVGMFLPDVYKKQGVFCVFAEKVGISETTYNKLKEVCDQAKQEAEADEDYQAYIAKRSAALAAEAQHEKDYKAIENAMTLNGRTY